MVGPQFDLPHAVVVRHHLDPERQTLERIVSDLTGIVEHEVIELEHAYVSCALREDVLPTLARPVAPVVTDTAELDPLLVTGQLHQHDRTHAWTDPAHLQGAFDGMLLTDAEPASTSWEVGYDGFEPWLGEIQDVA